MARLRWVRRARCVGLASVLLVLVAAALAGVPRDAAATGAAPFAGVTLEDPDGRKWELTALVGQPALLVVADRSASGKAIEWGRGIGAARPQRIALWAAPGKVATISVADLRVVPGFARGSARLLIDAMVDAQEGQGGPPLLLDWDGAIAGKIGAQEDVPNVRLYGSDGALVLSDAGEPTLEKIARLAQAIDGLFGAAVSAAPAPAVSATPTAASPHASVWQSLPSPASRGDASPDAR